MMPYTASKAGVIGMTMVIGREYAQTGITCNAIAPALIATAMTLEGLSREHYERLTARIPMRRTGTPEEVAALAAFIASRECSFSTGFTFDASGGRAVY
jgi:3-oxoacyl-[acyl-carrier protein] reductase